MKKIFMLLLTLTLLSGMMSCANQKTQQKTEQTTQQTTTQTTQSTITLTTDNIRDYLTIHGVYGKIERETKIGIPFGYSDIKISTYPVVPGDFYNAEITLKLFLTDGWDVSSSDPAYSDNDGYLTTTIKLPPNGNTEKVHDLIASMVFSNHNNSYVNVRVVSVSGTFVPK